MKRQSATLIAAVVLSALFGCDSSNPITGGVTPTPGGGGGGGGGNGGGGTTAVVVPSSLAANLKAVVYDPGNGTLQINIAGFDAPTIVGHLHRRPALDIDPGDGTTVYEAYTFQETTLNRRYLAYFAEGSHVMAGAVATETQFSTSFGGTVFDRSAAFVQPSTGSARYLGAYAGIINQTPNASTDRGTRVTGDAIVSVNFADSLIEGGITNRTALDTVDDTGQLSSATAANLADISLRATALANGTFVGDTYIGAQDVGDYGGVIGGANAQEVAGVMVFTPVNDPDIMEYGTFLLNRCGTANASPGCP